MSLLKNIIIASLILAFLGMFSFHWFFMDKNMTAEECFSADCFYAPVEAGARDATISASLVVLALIFAAAAARAVAEGDVLAAKLGIYNVFKDKKDNFWHNFYSWIAILEKRDPAAAPIAARIYG